MERFDEKDILNAKGNEMGLMDIINRLSEHKDERGDVTFGGLPVDVVRSLPKSFVKYWKGKPYRERRFMPAGDENTPVTVVISGGSRGKDGLAIVEALDDAGIHDFLRFRHSDMPSMLKFFKENKTSRPIRIIGHSWGGGAANALAKRLSGTNNIASVDLIDPVSYDGGKEVYPGARVYTPVYSPLNAYESLVHNTFKRVGLWRDPYDAGVTRYKGGHSDIKDAVRKIIRERGLRGFENKKAASFSPFSGTSVSAALARRFA